MLRDHFWLFTQGPRGPYGVPGIKPEFGICKANVPGLDSVISDPWGRDPGHTGEGSARPAPDMPTAQEAWSLSDALGQGVHGHRPSGHWPREGSFVSASPSAPWGEEETAVSSSPLIRVPNADSQGPPFARSAPIKRCLIYKLWGGCRALLGRRRHSFSGLGQGDSGKDSPPANFSGRAEPCTMVGNHWFGCRARSRP